MNVKTIVAQKTAEDITSKDVVEKVTKTIINNRYMETRHDNSLFYVALKKVGLDAYEILREAAQNLIETTKRKAGEKPAISIEAIFTWLSSWKELVSDEEIEAKVALRLMLIKGMIEGRYWIKQIGQNLVVITNGNTTYKLGNGWLNP